MAQQDFSHDLHTTGPTHAIPVVREFVTVDKEQVETGRILIRKTVSEETASVNLPIRNESYDIEHLPGSDQVLDAPPPIRRDGNRTIIPVIREILVTQKKYIVIEELQLIKKVTETPLSQEITLRTEHVTVTRTKTI